MPLSQVNTRVAQLTLAALVILTPLVGRSQERASDRRRYLSPSQTTTDDPRRVPIPSGPRGPDGTIVLRGGRIFDGTGNPARAGTVIVSRNKIDRVLPPGSTDWPKDAKVLDVTGMTVMPGLIDMHTHLTYVDPPTKTAVASEDPEVTLRAVERLRYFIESGITSVKDVSSDGDVTFRLKDWVSENRIIGPRVFPVGQLITSLGGHGAEGESDLVKGRAVRVAAGPIEWRVAVRDMFNRGADAIKVASHFSKDEIRAAVEEAHALGLKVTCDCETFYIQWAVEAGVDMIEHPLPRTDETIALMAQKGVEADPTVYIYTILFANSGGGYFGSTSRRFMFNDSLNFGVMQRMKRAGVKMGVGTDLVVDWFRYLPAPYINELKYLVQAGYSVPEALVAATKTNAQMLDMDDKLGTLEPGKLADVLVVNGRPDENLDDLAKVHTVIRDGWIVVQNGQLFVAPHVPRPAPAIWKPK
ncbi:MAG: amidohydrolase family protein [Gemmatimonadaceae bacterium]